MEGGGGGGGWWRRWMVVEEVRRVVVKGLTQMTLYCKSINAEIGTKADLLILQALEMENR